MSCLLRQRSLKRNNLELSTLTGYSVIFNTESIYFFFRNRAYREYVINCNNIFVDGAALSLVAKIFSLNIERYHGPDLLHDIEKSGLLGDAVLVGGRKENKNLVEDNILELWVDLPYLNNPYDLAGIALNVLRERKHFPIVLVSLGLPKQEMVCFHMGQELDQSKTLFLPLGAAIDFRTGVATRSSQIWRRFGLEWLPRLVREPRMFRRNVNSLIGLWYFFIHLLQRKYSDY